MNNATTLEDQVICSYGYTKADILGTYTFTGNSKYDVAQSDPKVVIAPSDNEDHALVVYDMFSTTHCFDDVSTYGYTYVPNAFTKFYADFDFDSGILTVFGDAVGAFDPALCDACAYGPGDDDEFTFAFATAGNGVLLDNVYMYGTSLGTWDIVLPGATLTRTDTAYAYTEPSPDPDPAPDPGTTSAKRKAVKVTKFVRVNPPKVK